MAFAAKSFSTDFETGTSGAIKLNLWLAQLSGLPILGLKKESFRLRVFLLLYGVPITILVAFIYVCFELYDLFLCWPNLDDITQNGCLSLTHVAGAFKIMNTFYRLKDISKVIDKFKLLTRKFVLSPEQRNEYLRLEMQNHIYLVGFALLVGFTGVFGIIFLCYDPENVAGKVFPFRVYLPHSLPYRLRLAYMGMSVLLVAIQVVSVDYLNITMINQIRFHLNTINLRLEELIMPNDAVTKESNAVIEKNNFKDANEVLRIIVEHHSHLKSLCRDIEHIFRMPLLIQFVISLSIYALTGFQATVHEKDTNGAIIIYLYCGCIFVELFLYCWFGNEVFEQNKKLATTGYNSSWYKYDIQFKRSFLIFLSNAQRPVLFTAGGFINLYLPSFAGILSRAYSYIAVLRQVYQKSA